MAWPACAERRRTSLMPAPPLAEVREWAGGEARGDDVSADRVTTDSRTQSAGSAFAAIRGDTYDGHAFVAEALSAGAPFAIVQDANALPDGAAGVVVDDVVVALG